ncbi:hypothetical protein [Flavicella marina]|uniref:hypothetical protein n=1 Tax=Flavicella marina TaxID=1475951 RepID=UPI001264A7DB|nr:hypothetical protein [Flavicella marina]
MTDMVLKKSILFSLRIIIVSAVFFYIHTQVLIHLGYLPYANMLIQGYFANVILAIFIVVALLFLKRKFNDQLGFLFMAGSLLKFAVFFIFFSPEFRADGEISRLEFLSFFVPYLFCLFLETFEVIRILNSTKKE